MRLPVVGANASANLVELTDAFLSHGGPPLRFNVLSTCITYEAGVRSFEMEVTSALTLDELLAIIGKIEDGTSCTRPSSRSRATRASA